MLDEGEKWRIHFGDCIPHMANDMEPASMDMAVFSPPFPSLFAYTSEAADLGNTDDLYGEAKLHLGWFYKALRRVVKPGRCIVVHVAQITNLKRNNLDDGLFDFRGMNIRLARRAGLSYGYDWTVRKNPQAQAIRTHSHSLLFVTLERDRAKTRGTLDDYLIKFTVPGENKVPIDSSEISRNEWISWAEGRWDDINETDTLNTREAKGEDDTKHICPLQLGVIDRLVKLYSNPGEIVFSPFTGIGSEGYQALKRGRRFYGCEIKREYYEAACRNLAKAEKLRTESERTLFDALEPTESH